MINLNISEETLSNEKQLAKVVNKLIYIKIVSKEGNALKFKENQDFYNGILPNIIVKDDTTFEPKIFNFAKPITDTATKAFIGEEPDIISSGKKEQKDKCETFKRKLYARQYHKETFSVGKSASIYGSGFLALYNEVGDIFPRFRTLNPQFCDVVYDCTLAQKPLLAFNIVSNEKLVSNRLTKNYLVYVYTKENLYVYETLDTNIDDPMKPSARKDFVKPFLSFKTSDGNFLSVVKHNFKDIPIIEFPNNEERKGDFDCVKDLISIYNNLQNNRCLNVHDIVNYVLMLKNVRVGDQTEVDTMLGMLREHRVLPVEGEDVDAKFLSNPLNQLELQTLANDIKQNIHYISRVPDLSSVDFSQNASDPIIKIKTKPLMDLCKEKELFFTEPYLKVLDLTLDFCNKYDNKASEYVFDLDLVSLEYSHDLPSNDLDMITQIANLANAKVLNPESALQHISWVKSVQNYIKGMTKYNEDVDKRAEKIKNNSSNNGMNETNKERQDKVIIDKGQLDNERNNALGLANKKVDSNE